MRAPRLAALEIKRFTRGRLPRAALVALLLLPLLYGALYLWSFWDPYGRLDRLPVALVVEDRPAEADGERVAAGAELAERLEDSATFDWRRTDAEDAAEGLSEGRYYLTLTIPADFSSSLASASGDDPRAGTIRVATDDANNYIVGQISRSVFSEIRAAASASASHDYYDNIFVAFGDLHDRTAEAADGAGRLADGSADAEEGSAALADGSAEAREGSEQLDSGLGDAEEGSGQLVDGLEALDAATGQLADGAARVAEGTRAIAETADGVEQEYGAALREHGDEIREGARLVAEAAEAVSQGAEDLPADADQAAGRAAEARDTLEELYREQCPTGPATGTDLASVDRPANSRPANGGATTAEPATDQTAAESAARAAAEEGTPDGETAGDGAGTPDQQSPTTAPTASAAPSGLDAAGCAALDTARAAASDAADATAAVAADLDDRAGRLTELAEQADAVAAVAEEIAAVPDPYAALHDRVEQLDQLRDGADQVAQGAAALHEGAPALLSGARSLDQGIGRLHDGAGTLSSGLYRLSDGALTLQGGLAELSGGAEELSQGLHQGADAIPDYDEAERDARSDVMSDPVRLARESLNPAATYGTGLAPYFVPLALWVGAMVSYMLLRPLSPRLLSANVPAWRAALAGWLPAAAVGVLQVLALLSVLHWAIGLRAAAPLATAAFLTLAALTFAAVLQWLNARFGAPGRLLGLALLMLQLTSVGGTYPVETSPGFFQAIHPYLPMTYVVEGTRRLLTEGVTGRLWTDCAVLAAFLLGALALTTVAARRGRTWSVKRLHPELTL
ncbi:YhgE/Pip domain-containing protein [Allostreptomyces psammosilenae]|uniref:Putative membrane protein n=1 Tax=Allostreptomyces psammosilenae TaxID=1892865 RepID=A0A852ZXK5_9ACTN|nr:YhgE/Pip domain-containing protein [Allostreptomyces psammosilenae]NYI07076.1 putative membrane protein [Allostreptomyces psammosilenae]